MSNELATTSEERYDILDLNPRQQQFVHLYLTGKYTQAQLAEMLGLHINTISSYARDECVKGVIAEMQKDQHACVAMGLKNLSVKALDALTELLDSPVDAVRLQAVKDVLDRSNHKATTKKEVNINQTVTFEQRMQTLINDTIYDVEVDGGDDE